MNRVPFNSNSVHIEVVLSMHVHPTDTVRNIMGYGAYSNNVIYINEWQISWSIMLVHCPHVFNVVMSAEINLDLKVVIVASYHRL